MVISLGQGADLHMTQLSLASVKSDRFWYQHHPGNPGQNSEDYKMRARVHVCVG